MRTLNSVVQLSKVIEYASLHCGWLAQDCAFGEHRERMLPLIVTGFQHELHIPAYGSIPDITVTRAHYLKKILSAFRFGKAIFAEPSTYGIGMYVAENNGRGWRCDSILFDESSNEPFLVNGHEEALKAAADEVRLRDKSSAKENERAIVEHGLMEPHVLNAILGELMRAEPDTIPAEIGIRGGRIQLLLQDDPGRSRPLTVPRGGFACRDDAAGVILQQIQYATDDACRHARYEKRSEAPAAA